MQNAGRAVVESRYVAACYIDPAQTDRKRKTLLFSNRDEYHGPPAGPQHYIAAQAHPPVALEHGQCYRFRLTVDYGNTEFYFHPEDPYDLHSGQIYYVPIYQIDTESIAPVHLGN